MSTQPLPLPDVYYPGLTKGERQEKINLFLEAYGQMTDPARKAWVLDQVYRINNGWQYEKRVAAWQARHGKNWDVGEEPASVKKALAAAYGMVRGALSVGRRGRPLANLSKPTTRAAKWTHGVRV